MNRDENKVLPADQVRGYLAMVEDDYPIQYPTDAIRDIARTALALMAQLEGAKAAQVMVLEKAAEAGEEGAKSIVRMCLPEPTASVERIAEQEIRSRIRALADPSGVEALAALRAERALLRADRDSAARMWQASEQEREAAVERSREASQMLAIETNHAAQAEAEAADLRARLAAAEAQVGALTNWRDDPESSEAWCAGTDYALTRLCKVLGVDPAKVSWDGSDGSLDEEADALLWRILRANDDEEGRSPAEADRDRLAADNAALEAKVQTLVVEQEALRAERDRINQWRETAIVERDTYSEERDDALARLAATEAQVGALREALDGNRPIPFDRETAGRFVREAWVRWAHTQPSPKASWLVPYDDLSEADKEADRQIGEALARWTLIHDAAALASAQGGAK